MQLCVCVSDKYFNNGPSCQNNFDLSSTYIMGQFHVWGAWLVSDVCVCDFVRLRLRPSWSDAGKGCFRGWAITGRPGNTQTHLPKMFAHSLPIQQVGDTKHQNLFSIYIYIYISSPTAFNWTLCLCWTWKWLFMCSCGSTASADKLKADKTVAAPMKEFGLRISKLLVSHLFCFSPSFSHFCSLYIQSLSILVGLYMYSYFFLLYSTSFLFSWFYSVNHTGHCHCPSFCMSECVTMKNRNCKANVKCLHV